MRLSLLYKGDTFNSNPEQCSALKLVYMFAVFCQVTAGRYPEIVPTEKPCECTESGGKKNCRVQESFNIRDGLLRYFLVKICVVYRPRSRITRINVGTYFQRSRSRRVTKLANLQIASNQKHVLWTRISINRDISSPKRRSSFVWGFAQP